MRGDLVNLNIKAFNKQSSGLIVKCLEIPHYAYSSRCALYYKTDTTNKINDYGIKKGLIKKREKISI